ncbi:MAG: glycosyltransferase family 2 protein [Marinilabiliaceae bacterium]|nr:glycosyltransferase family 2 protein [Marinilabiliaceae bacterium]
MKINSKFCVIIPAYNNENSLAAVIESVLKNCLNVIVINDGSTDRTENVALNFGNKITLISYKKNRGKGFALTQGFKVANKMDFEYALTIDADGQHNAGDMIKFFEAIKNQPNRLIIGARSFNNPNIPKGSIFANKFSNFWFRLQTAQNISDTQSGFRLYPIKKIYKMRLFTSRYETELELLVRCAWKGISIVTVPINVFYPPKEERVSHFRPKKDFLRISLLNTILCFFALFYGYPRMFFCRIFCNKK